MTDKEQKVVEYDESIRCEEHSLAEPKTRYSLLGGGGYTYCTYCTECLRILSRTRINAGHE